MSNGLAAIKFLNNWYFSAKESSKNIVQNI